MDLERGYKMPSIENSKPEESPKLSEIERMEKALSEIEIPLPPREPIPEEEGDGKFNFRKYLQKEAQRAVDNLNRNALKRG